jgi:hypothetical protein
MAGDGTDNDGRSPMGRNGAVLLPLYLVIDVSEALAGEGVLDAADAIVSAVAKVYPNLIPCGVGTARADTMAGLIHPAAGATRMPMYLAGPGYRPAQVITGIAERIISSMIRSGYGLGHGDAVNLPEVGDLPPGTARYEPGDFV